MLLGAINKILNHVGVQVVSRSQLVDKGAPAPSEPTKTLYYQHDYGDGAYDAYAQAQIDANKLNFKNIWAEELTLEAIADYIERHAGAVKSGLCHGAWNGWEVKWFKERLNCPIIGTDISETANELQDMVQHDFHKVREDWLGKFSFVYTNSLDHAFAPDQALEAWSGQITDDGHIFIEHSMYDAPESASEMDPFGAHPMIMPYLFFEWGKGKYFLADILKFSDVKMGEKGVFDTKGDVWIFVLKRLPSVR